MKQSLSCFSRNINLPRFALLWRLPAVQPPRRSNQLLSKNLKSLGFAYSRRPPYEVGGFNSTIFAAKNSVSYLKKSNPLSKYPSAGRGVVHLEYQSLRFTP